MECESAIYRKSRNPSNCEQMVKTPQEIRASYKTRKQNQSYAIRGNVRKPRTKSLRTAIAFDKNRQKKPSTMAKYRYGYNLAWKVKGARERFLALGFTPPGSYPNNQHMGVMFSMPYDIPKAFADEDAGWICRMCAQSKDPKCTKSLATIPENAKFGRFSSEQMRIDPLPDYICLQAF